MPLEIDLDSVHNGTVNEPEDGVKREMALNHPEYAHGISDEELIKEAIEFCDEELECFNGMEYDSDSEVACQRSNTFIRELSRRLKKTGEIVDWEWRIKKKNGEWANWKKGRVGDWVFDKDTEYEERPINNNRFKGSEE